MARGDPLPEALLSLLPGSGNRPRGEPLYIDPLPTLVSDAGVEDDDSRSRGLPRALNGVPRALTLRLSSDVGVLFREYRGGVTYAASSCGVAALDIGGRSSSLRCCGVSGISSMLSLPRMSGMHATVILTKSRLCKAYDIRPAPFGSESSMLARTLLA